MKQQCKAFEARKNSKGADGLWTDQIFWRDVDVRQKLKVYLAHEMDGNIERAAYVTLKVDGFPFDEVYEVAACL
jgi:hypothetical protein